MFLVWSVVFWRTGSFRKSTVAALVTGKTSAVVYKLAGLDRVVGGVYIVYYRHRGTGYAREAHVTAAEVLLLSFPANLLVFQCLLDSSTGSGGYVSATPTPSRHVSVSSRFFASGRA